MAFTVKTTDPKLSIVSQEVAFLDRPNYVRVDITAHFQGQVPADQNLWLVESFGANSYHPKRWLYSSSRCCHDVWISDWYLSSGNPQIERRPTVLIVSKFLEPQYWATLAEGRQTGAYKPLFLDTSPGQILAVGDVYRTSPQVS